MQLISQPVAHTDGDILVFFRKSDVVATGDVFVTTSYPVIDTRSHGRPNGDAWLIVTSTLEDPTYLAQPLMTSTHFKRESDGANWHPRPCEITLPVEGR